MMTNGAIDRQLSGLKEALRASFSAASLPAQEDVAPHDCKECRAIREAFAGRTWESLRPHEVEQRFDSLPMLSPSAFHYYLPAYLIYSLEHFKGDSLVCQFTIYAVAPNDGDDETRFQLWWRERMRKFTPEQFTLLERFLDLVSQDKELSQYNGVVGAKERLRRHYNREA